MKSVKGVSSLKAQVIHNAEDFLRASRLNLPKKIFVSMLSRPLNNLMSNAGETAIGSGKFIAEGLMKGVQITLEGLVQNGKVEVLGIVDWSMYPETNSFESF